MHKNFLCLLLCLSLYLLLAGMAHAQQISQKTVRAAVAEGYVNGLQARFIKYIVNKLDAELTLSTMPFARRIKAVREGQLDLMVGIQRTDDHQDEFIYLEPHYETLSYRFFALKQNEAAITQYHDLQGRVVGVNRHAKYFEPFNDDKLIEKVEVRTIENKVNLLLHERIDAFIHYQETAQPYLADQKLTESVVQSRYQPKHLSKYYVAISAKSWLMAERTQLQNIIATAVANGDFKKIRQNYYLEKYAN